ncbi:MAG: ATP-binding cassette domain-containing protein [Planctomycetaceae bacterium]|jgi:excinuclease ABC subunit A|nr:ATP-binding cassette domain-containing protein [Planctomycetaceae bacterium]
MSDIIIKGAREHNLCSVDLVLPRNKLICFTGVSGSGKSSLAFDTLYAEGQRRYVESLSSYARQFLGQLPKPDVDQIIGLSPSISISQKAGGQNTRSTVGTITEIYDFLRVLFARVGTGYCPKCGKPITAQTRQQIIDRIETIPEGTRLLILASVIRGQKGEFKDLFADLLRQGYIRARVDGKIIRLTDDLKLDRQMRHDIEVVIDRVTQSGDSGRNRLAETVERALAVGEGNMIVTEELKSGETVTNVAGNSVTGNFKQQKNVKKPKKPKEESSGFPLSVTDFQFSAKYACTDCGLSFEPPSPQLFSFNTPRGKCPKCDGLGEIHSFDPELLIPDPSKSFQQGCIVPIGKWRDLGRWRRHIFQGVAETLEKMYELQSHTILETAWEELDPKIQRAILWGTGDLHITYTWRNGANGHKWGGPYDGIIPKMLAQYRETKSKMQRLAMEKYMRVIPCGFCNGERLNEQARAFKIETNNEEWKAKNCNSKSQKNESIPKNLPTQLTLPQLCNLPINQLQKFFTGLNLSESGQKIAAEALKEIRNRLGFLVNVGLEYLTLGRTAPTLSGGEMQRIRLASQIGSGLVGVLYILDEPSIGLHPRDNDRLLATLARLRDLGNTVIVVEHDEDTMHAADLLVDFGPGPGVHGGHAVELAKENGKLIIKNSETNSAGSYLKQENRTVKKSTKKLKIPELSETELSETKLPETPKTLDSPIAVRRSSPLSSPFDSLTLKYLNGEESIPVPQQRRKIDVKHQIIVRGASHHNLKKIDVEIPLGAFVCVTGVSGSGKSSLVNDILVEALNRDLNRGLGNPGKHKRIDGLELLDKMIDIDQSPIGRGTHSNPSTYIKVFDEIRTLFAEIPESKLKGYQPGRFSFNVKGGRCEACEGRGTQKLEMDFLADIYVTCPVCQGRRFNHETLSVRYKGKSIDQILNMDVEETLELFENHPKIKHYLTMLNRVGLGYMKLGQPSPTLSGGEAQRIKLARELVKRSTGKTLYLLDEPTTGLHFSDIKMLLGVLHEFVDTGNTVLVVEHNLDVIKTADWIIDLGPEGGDAGGYIVATGTPEDLVHCEHSYTGQSLKKYFNKNRTSNSSVSVTKQQALHSGLPKAKQSVSNAELNAAESIIVRGAEEHNLKNISVEIPRNKMTICCGPSGSGKSSLAMDTVYAEGQRRYVESLSSYARQFIGQLQKPRVEQVEGLSPAIAIEQKAASHSPRSTVGTITEIQDYLRVLFARLGIPYCPQCDIPVGTQTLDEIVAKIAGNIKSETESRILIAAPILVEVGQIYDDLWKRLRSEGFNRIRINGNIFSLENPPEIDRRRKHDVELIIDRIVLKNETGTFSVANYSSHPQLTATQRSRITDSVETALSIGQGVVHVIEADTTLPEQKWKRSVHSQHLACEKCGRSFERLTPHHFSANSSLGWCPNCEGLGVQQGANPAIFLKDPKRTLAEGAVLLFPDVQKPIAKAMFRAFAKQTGIPLDISFDQLDARHRRLIFHGTGETWFSVELTMSNGKRKTENSEQRNVNQSAVPQKSTKKPVVPESNTSDGSPTMIRFQFQYKGLYPSMEEATRLVPSFRGQMDEILSEVECGVCMGSRLRDDVSAVRFIGYTMDQICRLPLNKLLELFEHWQPNETERQVAGDLLNEIKNRLRFLSDVGLDYLTLSRSAPTLSGGETQRIRLAAQIGSGLVGVLYVLDEPTIGLHPRDNQRLIEALRKLRDLGNTLLVVEHDREVIASADLVLDFGPQAGKYGGEVVAHGSPERIVKQRGSVTGVYLNGKKTIPIPTTRRISPEQAASCPTRKCVNEC